MMLSKPVASGAMLLLLVGAVGGAALQGDQSPEAAVVEIADAETPAEEAEAAEVIETAQANEAEAEVEAEEPAERTATAPNRVVESAGFPVVPQAERDRGQAETAGPVVTVNGRPLGSSAAPEGGTATAATSTERTEPEAPEASEPEETQVAVIPPPLPQPRPANLPVREAEPAMDYDAIAEAAYGQQSGVLTPPTPPSQPQTQALAPMQGVNQFSGSGRNPDQDELVGVVGPNGEMLWVYEDQVQSMNSRVTIQRPQQFNPFGFVYE